MPSPGPAANDPDNEALIQVGSPYPAELPSALANQFTLQRLKSSLHYPLGLLVDSTTLELGTNATPQFIGTLTELVHAQIENAAQDLEAFARHRNAKRIETRDVLLLGRRNEGLKEMLEKEAEKIKKAMEKNSGKEVGRVKQNGSVEGGRAAGGRVEKNKRGKRKGKRASRLINDEASENNDSQAEEVEEMELDYDEEDEDE